MKYIGIDVSSKKLNIHVKEGDVEQDYEILNTEKEISKFIEDQKLGKEEVVIGAESTGRNHLMAQKIFVEEGFRFRLINPILTNKRIKLTIRNKKTDESDAQLIAELISRGEGDLIKKRDLDETKRTILRTRQAIVKHKSSIQVMLKDLKKDPNKETLKVTTQILESLLSNFEDTIKNLEQERKEQYPKSDTERLIESIPGFATTLSGIVASEVRDINRFPSSTEFKAYVGVDPRVIQSGSSCSRGKITKRGNAHLRYAFYMAAQVARMHDPELKAFYEKKRSEGKHYKVAIVAVARKLCERVYAVMKRGTPYQIRSREQVSVA